MKGSATITLTMVIGALFTWCSALSIALFNDHAQLASIATSVEDIKSTVHQLADQRILNFASSTLSNRYGVSN